MIKIKILTLLLLLGIMPVSANNPEKEESKIVLPYLKLKDAAIEFVAFDINSMILRKNRGFLWPATKITFSKKGEKMLFDIMAIDNSWCNMFQEGEIPYGYIVVDRRIFIVSTKKDDPVELEKYFERSTEIERTFNTSNVDEEAKKGNPKWQYLHMGDMATVLDSTNMGKLGR